MEGSSLELEGQRSRITKALSAGQMESLTIGT